MNHFLYVEQSDKVLRELNNFLCEGDYMWPNGQKVVGNRLTITEPTIVEINMSTKSCWLVLGEEYLNTSQRKRITPVQNFLLKQNFKKLGFL